MSIQGPDPEIQYPLSGTSQLVFLKHFITAPNIFVGDYTYYDDARFGPEKFEELNILYNYDFKKVKLVIGKFCALASGTKFMLTGDHKLDAISTYPFPIFGNGWEKAFDIHALPVKGDIIVGNDVWFGYDSFVRGGVNIGDGAIIASRSVVVKDVPPYTIVGGNPAKILKMRFSDSDIERLLKLSWWDWEVDKIGRHLKAICQLDISRLENAE